MRAPLPRPAPTTQPTFSRCPPIFHFVGQLIAFTPRARGERAACGRGRHHSDAPAASGCSLPSISRLAFLACLGPAASRLSILPDPWAPPMRLPEQRLQELSDPVHPRFVPRVDQGWTGGLPPGKPSRRGGGTRDSTPRARRRLRRCQGAPRQPKTQIWLYPVSRGFWASPTVGADISEEGSR